MSNVAPLVASGGVWWLASAMETVHNIINLCVLFDVGVDATCASNTVHKVPTDWHTDGWTGRETDRKADRQTDRQTDKQTQFHVKTQLWWVLPFQLSKPGANSQTNSKYHHHHVTTSRVPRRASYFNATFGRPVLSSPSPHQMDAMHSAYHKFTQSCDSSTLFIPDVSLIDNWHTNCW